MGSNAFVMYTTPFCMVSASPSIYRNHRVGMFGQ